MTCGDITVVDSDGMAVQAQDERHHTNYLGNHTLDFYIFISVIPFVRFCPFITISLLGDSAHLLQ